MPTRIEYMCTYCGKKISRSGNLGRPDPGSCPRKPKNPSGKSRPHTWVVNRKWG